MAGSRYPALSNRQPQFFWQEAMSKSFEVKTSKTVLQKDASVSKTITVRNQMSPKSDLRHGKYAINDERQQILTQITSNLLCT